MLQDEKGGNDDKRFVDEIFTNIEGKVLRNKKREKFDSFSY